MTNSQTYRNAGQLLVSRRAFLYGAAATGAAAAVGMGLAGCSAISGGDEDVPTLEVPESSLITQNDLQVLESANEKVQLIGNFDIPYGTLLWADDNDVVACLLPTETGSPLAQIGLLFPGSGSLDTVIGQAIGAAEHFEIYDVRASSGGLIWTEANVLKGTWRVYTARLAGGGIDGNIAMVDEGDSSFETPMLAVAANRAFWQVMPKASGNAGQSSKLMSAPFGQESATTLFESARRMATPPYSSGDSITITPRLDMGTPYYQLTNIDVMSGAVNDTLTLPSGMKPLQAAYGRNGFMFSFADIYNYGGGISNLGTYTPARPSAQGDYSSVKWFGFARTPSAAPAWCNDLLIVKSSYSVCGIDLNEGTYFAIEVDNGADNYGDYLATSGSRPTFVTFANIDHKPVAAPAVRACRVKIWTTIA